ERDGPRRTRATSKRRPIVQRVPNHGGGRVCGGREGGRGRAHRDRPAVVAGIGLLVVDTVAGVRRDPVPGPGRVRIEAVRPVLAEPGVHGDRIDEVRGSAAAHVRWSASLLSYRLKVSVPVSGPSVV